MNKKEIDRMIPQAYSVLDDSGIAKDGEINKTWRGQISSFGAAISTGSLIAAVSFFSAQAGSEVRRELLMIAIAKLIGISDNPAKDTLFIYIRNNKNEERRIKEKIINTAIALKLAMNLYTLV